MKISNLNELFLHELKDLYDAEHQLVEALPKMAEAATAPELVEAFQNHLEETRGHVTRLEEVFAALGEEPDRETCKGMKGLISEGERVIKEVEDGEAKDAGLIGAAQRVEHYEIAAYGTLKVWALTAGIEAAELEANLAEEKAADEKLTEIAEAGINQEAEAETESAPRRKTSRARPVRAGRSRGSRSSR